MLTYNDLHLVTEKLCHPKSFPTFGKLYQQPASVWIASGLAKVSAIYGAFLMEKYVQRLSRFTTPLRYLQHPTPQSIPILISLRGKHPDSIAIANFFANTHCNEAIFLTADTMGNAASVMRAHGLAKYIISTELPERDKRTVNFNSIFILTSLIHQVVASTLEESETLNLDAQIMKSIFEESQMIANEFTAKLLNIKDWSTKQFIILSDGIPSELCLTWQSIMSEAGLFTPVCSDIKDYTHGDHLAAVRIKQAIFIVISHPETFSISDIFCQRFSLLFPVFHIRLTHSGLYSFWQNLFIVMNFASILTESLGYPDQRLPKHPVVHNWRGWGDI